MCLPVDGLNELQPNQIHKFSFDMEGRKIGIIFRVDPVVFVKIDRLSQVLDRFRNFVLPGLGSSKYEIAPS